MSQPQWKLCAQLGDADPVGYGGYWIFEDTTGVYAPEGEYTETGETETDPVRVYRFSLDRCTFIDGVLSDNKFHPECRAWFADELQRVANCNGVALSSIVRLLCSDKATDRAQGYRMIGEYHGMENLDDYPLTLTAQEAIDRYKQPQYKE